MADTAKETAYLTSTGPSGEEVRVPVVTVHGSSDGPTLGVIAGVHGSEYDGIEATKRFADWIDPGALRGTVIAVPCLNVPGFYGLAMHVNPVDNENPGRAAPGDASGSHTQRMMDLAWRAAVEPADYVVDVHGGDLEEELVEYSQVEVIGNADVDARGEALARALDMPFFVRREARQATIGSGGPIPLVAALNGKPAVLAEAGSHGILDEACVAAHLKGLCNALRHLDMIDGDLEVANPEPVELKRFVGFPAPVDGLWYPEVLKGEIIAKGQRLGEMRDFFGNTLAVVDSPENAAILGVMTILPRRAGDMLMGVGTLD